MNIEEIKELVEETFIENVMSNLDSALIFTYIQNLEQQCKKQKEVIDKIRKEISEEHSIMGVEVVENWVLEDILKEVE